MVVVICARKDAIVLAGWNALLGQWIDWDTTDVLMRVRILHGVQNFLAILPESFFIQQHKGISKQSRINGRRGLLTRVCSLW